MAENAQVTPILNEKPRFNELKRFSRVFFGRGLVVFGTIVIIVFLIASVFGGWIAPYDPNLSNLDEDLAPPSTSHLLGTDNIGRDTLSRLIVGARTSLFVGVIALSIAAILGMALGMIAGYFGGIINAFIMRIVDVIMSFPMIVAALLIAGILGGGILNVMIAIGISMIPGYARLMCGMVQSAKEADYVMAEQSLGTSNFRLMLRHILPNCFPPILVMATMNIGVAILSEAGLSYLGIGLRPPAPSWGSMVSYGYAYLTTDPLLSFAPGLCIMAVVFAFNMVGDGLRDALDPRLRGVL